MFHNVNVIHTMNGAPYKRDLLLFLHGQDREAIMDEIAFILTGLEIDLDRIVKLDIEPIGGLEHIRLEPMTLGLNYA